MIDLISLPELGEAEITELARMLLARKLMPEDKRGTLSPMVNAPLAQCVILRPEISLSLADWLPRLKKQFLKEMSDVNADPSLSRHLRDLDDNAAQRNLIGQYFLPFQADREIDISSAPAMVAAFDGKALSSSFAFEMGPLYPTTPKNGLIELPRPFMGPIFDQVLIGRHSHIHLEMRRRGQTNELASDNVILAMIDVMAASKDDTLTDAPFRKRELRTQDFVQSFAYTQMMELGFSRDELIKVLTPWNLID